MTDLEERTILRHVVASGPAFGLRDDVARASIPPLRRRPRSHRRRWVIAAVATVAIVIGLVEIGTNRNDQSIGNDPARLHWLINDVPDDLPLVALLDPTIQSHGERVGDVQPLRHQCSPDGTAADGQGLEWDARDGPRACRGGNEPS